MAYDMMTGQAVGSAQRLMDESRMAAGGPISTAPTRPIPAALDELSNAIGDVNALLEGLYSQLQRAGVLKPTAPEGAEVARNTKDSQSEMEARIREMTSRLNGSASGLRLMLTHLQL